MLHQYAPLAAFVGLLIAIAGSAMLAYKPSPLALGLVLIGSALNATPYM